MTPLNFAHALRDFAGRIHTIRRQIRTERALNTLPPELRKDIGWPDRFDDRGPFRR